MPEKSEKPGVLLYFSDIRPAIQRLSLKDRGALLTAIIDFAELGIEPELRGMTGLCFDMLRPKIERDGERYKQAVEQRRYAVFCREAKKTGASPPAFEEWMNQNRETSADDRETSADIERYPTINPTVNPTVNPTASAARAAGTKVIATMGEDCSPQSAATRGDSPQLSPDEFDEKRRASIRALLGV